MYSKLIIFSSFVAFVYGRQAELDLAAPLSDDLVIGGTNAAKGEFPHQVSLQWGSPPFIPFNHMCGGSIINEHWILTAAHCVYNLPQSGQFVVRAGKNLVKARETTEQVSYASFVIIHDRYEGGVYPYDIALIKLSTPFIFNSFVKSIELPKANTVPQGVSILSGWGSISTTKQAILPDYLQKVTLPLLNIDICRVAFKLINEQYPVHDTNICTGPLTGGYSACNGDSGGPLIAYNEQGTPQVIGVVSWGHIPCGEVGAPAVFVRVSAFVDWIHNAINAHSA